MHGKGRELNVRGMVLVFSSFWEVVEAILGQKWDFTTAAVPMNVSIKGGRPVVKGIRLKSSFTHNQVWKEKIMAVLKKMSGIVIITPVGRDFRLKMMI
jgi:hypothetical protein